MIIGKECWNIRGREESNERYPNCKHKLIDERKYKKILSYFFNLILNMINTDEVLKSLRLQDFYEMMYKFGCSITL